MDGWMDGLIDGWSDGDMEEGGIDAHTAASDSTVLKRIRDIF